MIARVWRGITPNDQADAYLAYLRDTAMPSLHKQPGLRGDWTLRREQGEQCEFLLVTLWESEEALRAWAGERLEQAIAFDEDQHYLLDMKPLVRLYEVADHWSPD